MPKPVIGHVLHRLALAGAEVLAAELARKLGDRYRFVFLCLDETEPGSVTPVDAAPRSMADQMRDEGFAIEAMGRRPGIDCSVARRLGRAARKHGIDLLHAHQYTPFFYAALSRWMPGGFRGHILFTEHGRHYPDSRKVSHLLANRLLLGRRDRVTAVGQFIRQALAENEGIDLHRIDVIHNGIPAPAPGSVTENAPAQRREARKRMGVDRHDLVLIQVARFHPVKDHETAIHAFAFVAQQVPRAKLVLVGEGELMEQARRQVEQLELGGRVIFMGVRNDVNELLPGADLFLLSSLSEGISVTLLEAMAAGLAICATRVGGNPEVVDHGRNGLLSPRRDPRNLADNIITLLTDPHLRAAMGAAGLRRLKRYFNQQTMHRAYDDLYTQMLARRT
ncbi:MAG: glycosyltransferase [Phycisphaeraceae bacterium]|nr:glycosyltransferase [Phycisphaeraceae bacterium]